MNTLARLLEHEQYDQWVGMDNILDTILPPSSRRSALDADIGVADYRFCRTLGEIRGRLGLLSDGGRPTFVYSLPQDIHVSVITREGAAPVDSESYGPFYPPYASRIRRFDACFGEFIDDLKARGLFERSIVIVTSDHGDSLGEQGRMGHAYTIFPEIIQVPLIVHLPSALSADPSRGYVGSGVHHGYHANAVRAAWPCAAAAGPVLRPPAVSPEGGAGTTASDGIRVRRLELWECVRRAARRCPSFVRDRRYRPSRVFV